MATYRSFLKGKMTRYINILKKETQCGLNILAKDVEIIDESKLCSMINKCVFRIHIYCDKVNKSN